MTLVYLTQALCHAAVPRERRYDLRDSLVRGLFLRVEVSGRRRGISVTARRRRSAGCGI